MRVVTQKHTEIQTSTPSPPPPLDLVIQKMDEKFDRIREDFDGKLSSISKENKLNTELVTEKITKTYSSMAAKQQKNDLTLPALRPALPTRL